MSQGQDTVVEGHTAQQQVGDRSLRAVLEELSTSANGCHTRLSELNNAVEDLRSSIDKLGDAHQTTSVTLSQAATGLTTQSSDEMPTAARATESTAASD